MDVAKAWDVIHDWLDRNYPELRPHLNRPAGPAALAALEREAGVRLPDDFKASYRIHDGSAVVSRRPYEVCRVIAGLPLLPLKEVRREWKRWAGYAADEDLLEDLNPDYRASPEGAVKPAYADRGWVPFAGGESHYVALDFAPGPRGVVGQVINFGRDDYVRHVIAPTFTAFLGFVAGLFAAGEIVRNPESSFSLVVKRTGKDLLLSLPELLAARGTSDRAEQGAAPDRGGTKRPGGSRSPRRRGR